VLKKINLDSYSKQSLSSIEQVREEAIAEIEDLATELDCKNTKIEEEKSKTKILNGVEEIIDYKCVVLKRILVNYCDRVYNDWTSFFPKEKGKSSISESEKLNAEISILDILIQNCQVFRDAENLYYNNLLQASPFEEDESPHRNDLATVMTEIYQEEEKKQQINSSSQELYRKRKERQVRKISLKIEEDKRGEIDSGEQTLINNVEELFSGGGGGEKLKKVVKDMIDTKNHDELNNLFAKFTDLTDHQQKENNSAGLSKLIIDVKSYCFKRQAQVENSREILKTPSLPEKKETTSQGDDKLLGEPKKVIVEKKKSPSASTVSSSEHSSFNLAIKIERDELVRGFFGIRTSE